MCVLRQSTSTLAMPSVPSPSPSLTTATKQKIDLRKNYAALEAKKGKVLNAHKLYNITPIENKHFLDDAKKVIKPGKAILVICRTGARSKFAANILAKNGFENVYNVEGGFLAWKKAKLPYGGE